MPDAEGSEAWNLKHGAGLSVRVGRADLMHAGLAAAPREQRLNLQWTRWDTYAWPGRVQIRIIGHAGVVATECARILIRQR